MASEMSDPTYSHASRHVFSSRNSVSVRPSRVWNESSSAAASYTGTGMAEFARATTPTRVLRSVVDILTRSGLPGPMVLIGGRKYLGQGSQFAVYKDNMVMTEVSFSTLEVAVKQPKFDLDPDMELNLSKSEVQKHLHDMYLEILALTNPAIQAHPNISRLVAWSTSTYGSFHEVPILIMELAESDLAMLLVGDSVQLSSSQKYSLCQDIAAGLDALHDCRLVHGDLKPENILIFGSGGRIVAKLADFGLSVDEVESDCGRACLGGTLGWQAPEVEIGTLLQSGDLLQTDIYSFGLVLWSVMLHSGKVPPMSGTEARQVMAKKELENARDVIGLDIYPALADALQKLLEYDSRNRPLYVTHLLDDIPDGETRSENLQDSEYSLEEYQDVHTVRAKFKYFLWELDSMPDSFVHALYFRLLNNSEVLPGNTLFAIFLAFTIHPPRQSNLPEHSSPVATTLDVLLIAALSGYEPAQGTIPTASKFFELELEGWTTEFTIAFLKSAVATGSTIAKPELENLDPPALCDAIGNFRSKGGYNRFHSTVDPSFQGTADSRNQTTYETGFRYSHIHWLVTYGTPSDIMDYLSANKEYEIDGMTDDQSTPLYLACARGSWEVADQLLRNGACPSIKCTEFEISCMHWVFAFDEQLQAEAVIGLRCRGADINALASQEVPFFHYPFLLPAGSPLHWAVATLSHTAIKAFVEQGADLLIRDGSDPYTYDERIRALNRFGSQNLQAHSVSETVTQGLSPLDLAASQHDPFIFELLVSLGGQVKINAVDEEGFSVLHRLSASNERRTRTGNAFSTLPFRGSRVRMRDDLRRTVAAIKALGGDMELLTTPQSFRDQYGEPSWRLPSRTPLMLAVMNSATEVVQALLEVGANVHTENEEKDTALLSVTETVSDGSDRLEIARLLVSFGGSVHHRGESGETLVVKAAAARDIDVVEFCLSKGADINERQQDPRSSRQGATIFHLLASTNYYGKGGDIEVARLFERYVLGCLDLEKKRSVIELGDIEGETLLHCFANMRMPRCVETLVSYGAPINALQEKYTVDSGEDVSCKVSWHETPLDVAIHSLEKLQREQEEDGLYPKREYEELVGQCEAIITILRRAGGVLACKEVVRKPFVYDFSGSGPGEYQRALREC